MRPLIYLLIYCAFTPIKCNCMSYIPCRFCIQKLGNHNGAVLSDSRPQGLLEKNYLRGATFPNGFEVNPSFETHFLVLTSIFLITCIFLTYLFTYTFVIYLLKKKISLPRPVEKISILWSFIYNPFISFTSSLFSELLYASSDLYLSFSAVMQMGITTQGIGLKTLPL